MKWYAGQNKTEQASVLAIVETLAASCVAIWFAVHYQTLMPFAISVLVAPLLLLRTRDSTALGIRWARRLNATVQLSWLTLGIMYLAPAAIRVGATIAIMATSLTSCLRTMPSNWWRLVSRIDSSVVPEPIPGLTGQPDIWTSEYLLSAPRRLLEIGKEEKRLVTLATTLIVVTMICAVFGPAFLYRWALKSSWWVYCPLLWVMSPGTRRPPPAASAQEAQHRLIARVIDQPFVLIWSAVVVAVCVAKIWLWQMRTVAAEWFNEQPVLVFFKPYIEPDSMPLWQWTALANGVLAFAMYFAARATLHAEEDEKPWPPELVDRGFRIAMIVRRALTVYAIAVMVAITARRGLPPVGAIWPV